MEIASLIISIIGCILSFIGIMFSIFAWKYSYKLWHLNQELKNIKFDQELTVHSFCLLIEEYCKKGQTNPFVPDKDPIKWALFNMVQNIKSIEEK